jgi:ABC-type ATPase with predicted acetyltransferase domain
MDFQNIDRQSMQRATKPLKPIVEKNRVEGVERVLTLSDGNELRVHRYACIGKGDSVRITGRGADRTVAVECRNGEAAISPAFHSTTSLPGISTPVYLKEIDQQSELDAYERLSSYHYRNQASFGRRSIIIAKVGTQRNARVVGYIEITNTFSGHEARNKLLNAPYADQHIYWEKWDPAAKSKYLNSIARISRCVVHPEYRGLGLGKALCAAAISFSKTSWQIAGLKPIFLEITADMLKFVPFAEKAGMTFIGSTTGNLKRLVKDQTYLRSVKDDIVTGVRAAGSHSVFSDGSKSILQRQKRDVTEMEKLSNDSGIDVMDVLRLFASAKSASEFPPSAYELLHRFVRFPKPTYMIGLNPAADAFIQKRVTELQIISTIDLPDISIPRMASPIVVENLTLSHRIEIPKTDWSNALQEAFGIHQDAIAQTGIRSVSLAINPGEVLYLWGASGSGKTIFLDAIQRKIIPTEGFVRAPRNLTIGTLNMEFSDQPLVVEVGGATLKESLYALAMVGLSEANLFFKSPKHLSNGQRYRLALAKLILSRSQVWIIDEFCSVLDDGTAELISWNVARFARKLGVTAIVAGPRKEPVLKALAPDRMLSLDSLGDWRVTEMTR